MTACLDRAEQRDGATTGVDPRLPQLRARAGTGCRRSTDHGSAGPHRATPLVTGIPLALKDLYAAKGLPVTASSKVLAGNHRDRGQHGLEPAACRGMVLLGHAETDEFAIGVGTTRRSAIRGIRPTRLAARVAALGRYSAPG